MPGDQSSEAVLFLIFSQLYRLLTSMKDIFKGTGPLPFKIIYKLRFQSILIIFRVL